MNDGIVAVRRPIWTPVMYGLSTTLTGIVSYTFGMLCTESWQAGMGWAFVFDGALLLYLTACSVSASKEGN